MNPNSAPGPDGLSSKFFDSCWDIIAHDLLAMVLDFFHGNDMSRSFTHTCLFLLPKTDSLKTFSEFRPISLSKFSSKIMPKLLNNRFSNLMNSLISPNQSGFIKGRVIYDNVMLTQELVHNMNKGNGNIILKLDIAKAFDRISSTYLSKVKKCFGFSEKWLHMIWRLLENNWHSININGTRHSFFNSSRGVKQVDPLSPSLFAIGAEFLSVLMDQLIREGFTPYYVDSNSPKITHLCYANDTILFFSNNHASLTNMMHKLSLMN